jgi:hypothetical protein
VNGEQQPGSGQTAPTRTFNYTGEKPYKQRESAAKNVGVPIVESPSGHLLRQTGFAITSWV